MRQITKSAATAFASGGSFRLDNTEVDGDSFMLHGNTIARHAPNTQMSDNCYVFSMCGWATPTTRERLNGLFEVLGLPLRVYQHKGEQYVWVRGPLPEHEVNISPDSEFFFAGGLLHVVTRRPCYQCGSHDTYLSPNGYDTVRVCNACHGEQHEYLEDAR